MTAALAAQAAVIALAQGMEEGAPCEGELRAAVQRAMEARRQPGDPPAPQLNGMVLRRSGLPLGWHEDGNLLLAPAGMPVELHRGLSLLPVRRNLGLVGAEVHPPKLVFPGDDGLIAIGDRACLPYAEARAHLGGATLIGEDTTAKLFAQVESRNGGAIIIGADNMWASPVSIVTDDMHAIREVGSGRRTNGFGQRIVIERHVWLCDQVSVLGGARIGENTVVGAQSLVKTRPLPPNSVCVGSPARPVRTGTIWTREDSP